MAEVHEGAEGFESLRSRINWLINRRFPDQAWSLIEGNRTTAFPFRATVSHNTERSVQVRFPDGTIETLDVRDPQVREAIPVGTEVVVGVFPDTTTQTLAEFKADQCRWVVALRLWSLPGAEPAK